jgi:hypothetical protein
MSEVLGGLIGASITALAGVAGAWIVEVGAGVGC